MTEAQSDNFLRSRRTAPLTKAEMKQLGQILTRREFEAVLLVQSDRHRALFMRQLLRDAQLH
jgi:hypothetical protein